MLLKKLLPAIALLWVTGAQAQIETKTDTLSAATREAIPAMYRPQLFGGVKAKVETSLYGGDYRFNVRHSRIGVKGLVSPQINYQMQIDFHNEGNLTVLDAYVGYKPWDNFEFILGQQQYGFSTDLSRGPSNNIFVNRSLLGKFLTSYYGPKLSGGVPTTVTESIGARDLGARVNYTLRKLPIKFVVGAFNGTGLNNPEWTNRVNLIGRVEVGRKEGFGVAVAHYNGYSSLYDVTQQSDGSWISEHKRSQRMIMWGGEVHYIAGDFRIEAEYAQRELKGYGRSNMLTAGHVQGYYIFRMAERSRLSYIAPVGRWDIADNVDFINKDNGLEKFTANRATIGINLGFSGSFIDSEIRLQFEKYFLDGKPSDYSRNPLLQDKLSLEFIANF